MVFKVCMGTHGCYPSRIAAAIGIITDYRANSPWPRALLVLLYELCQSGNVANASVAKAIPLGKGSLLVKLLLPGGLFLSSFAEERRERADVQQSCVEPVPGLLEWPREIHEQHHAITVGVIPDFVVVGIVEDQCLTLGPVAIIVADADAHLFAWLRHEQAEMEAEQAVVGAAMGRDVFVGGQNGEERRRHAWNPAQQPHGFRTTRRILATIHADTSKEKSFPVIVR